MALTVRRVLLVAFLSAIVIAKESRASSAFLMAPLSRMKQQQQQWLDRKHASPTFTRKKQSFDADKASTLVRRGGAFKSKGAKGEDDDDEEALTDYGGSVAGLFGNLRIPASLIAGASLGSAFALPMLDTDSVKIGMAKRLYAFSMITTLGSMLLVVIVSTIVMNDIALRPKKLTKSCGDYIEKNYACEWMIVRSHFFYGSFAFLGGSAFRAYISIACPVIGRGVLGILASLSMICMSYLVEKTSGQCGTAQSYPERISRFLTTIGNKAKSNLWFGAGIATWVAAVSYLIYKLPHMYTYLASM